MNGIPSTPNPFAFIQARLGSTRLPNKILSNFPFPNEPETTVLDHIFKRLSKLLPSDQIIFLIPDSDFILRDKLKEKGYSVFLGSESDVLDRFSRCANFYEADHIFRLTGDNPFLDLNSIELLWEAMFHIRNPLYCIAMSGLPLGMGVEAFSRETLKAKPDSGWLPYHKEHVSLHAKENPNQFQIKKFSPPFLSDEDQLLSASIRMTLDEPSDLKLLDIIWQYFKDSSPFFGVKELLQFYLKNPNNFEINKNVEQVKFDLPKPKNSSTNLGILYGKPEKLGYGHFVRCQSLSIELQSQNWNVRLSDTSEKFKEMDKIIVDARDTIEASKSSIFIDRGKKDYYFLPHPDSLGSKNYFYSSPILEWFLSSKKSIIKKNQTILYLGNLDIHQTKMILAMIPKNRELIQIGGQRINDDSKYYPRLTKIEYYRLLKESDEMITYYGQSCFEAMYLDKAVALFSMTDDHEMLANYANKEFGVSNWGRIPNLTYSKPMKPFFIPQRNAQKNLIQSINEEFNSY